MQDYNTTAVKALSEQIGRVLQDSLAEALLLAKQEDSQLRDLG
jgi:hypothetical protein